MKAGQLVPDAMILRLIINELKTRGWLYPQTPNPTYTLASNSATLDASNFITETFLNLLGGGMRGPTKGCFVFDIFAE